MQLSDKTDQDASVEIVDVNEEYEIWLSYSQADYDCAEYLKDAPMKPKPYNIICYHYQQAAEKAAKALVVYYKCPGGMAKIHDVDFQLGQIKNIIKEDKGISVTDELIGMASDISIYASEPRYPNEVLIDDKDMEKAREYCIAIIEWVKNAIDAPKISQ